jgi:hypothetical protein
MRNNPKANGRNFWRRAVGVVVCLSPLWLIMVSVLWGLLYPDRVRITGMPGSITLITIALMLSSLNFYLAFIRPALFQNRADYRNISGIPMFGSFCVIGGILMGFGEWSPALAGGVAVLLDTGGLPWFLVSTWRDSSFWDS